MRFRVESGHRGGKWGRLEDDNYLVESDDMALVRLLRDRPPAPTHTFEVASAQNGKTLNAWRSSAYDIATLTAARSSRSIGLPGEGRVYWSNRFPAPDGDPALESMLNPPAWGWLSFAK